MKKVEFKNSFKHGIKSFKITNINSKINDREKRFETKLQKLSEKLNNECIEDLKVGYTQGSGKGVNVNIEAPKCCLNYAEFNIDRKVPMRQYFGKVKKKENDFIYLWTYGVGSGSTTVGGDINTTQTCPLTKTMKEFCEFIKANDIFTCYGKHCIAKENLDYNHVSILYYLMDSKRNNKICLKPHCDLEVNASNHVKQNNSQRENTPTVVVALQNEKNVDFYKRYVSGKSFEDIEKIDSMKMKHGDIFVLHPDDERVIGRSADINKGIKKKSQFQHGVTCKLQKSLKKQNIKYKLSISVCFRQTTNLSKYSCKSNLLVDENDMLAQDQSTTKAGIKRKQDISWKKKELENEKNITRIGKKLRKFHRISKMV